MNGNYGAPISAVHTARIMVGTTPVKAATQAGGRVTRARTTLEIYVPQSSVTTNVYMGGYDVTATTGIPIAAGTRRLFPVYNKGGAAEIYLIADSTVEVVIGEYIS